MRKLETERLLLRPLTLDDSDRGLKYEGTLKQHVSRFGQFYDLTYYGLLKDEFENNSQL